MDIIRASIEKHGSTTQKELSLQYKGFDISQEVRKYYSTIIVSDFSQEELNTLISKDSKVLIENGPYEWPIYQNIIGTYGNDRRYKNLFRALKEAQKEGRISCLHGGGHTTYIRIIEQNNQADYRNVFQHKACIVFDRDTDDATSFDKEKNPLFRFLCGKDSSTLTNNDIYGLNQQGYIWHAWYKRTIENYFPDRQFSNIGVDTSSIPTDSLMRDYYKFGNLPQYDKNKLKDLKEGMSRSDYENGLKHFIVNDEDISELQLFLLKLVKII
jgi:hypothetical protein